MSLISTKRILSAIANIPLSGYDDTNSPAYYVNKAIAKTLPGYELIQADGYTYFAGNDCPNWSQTETGYIRVSARTPEEWVTTLKRMIQEHSPCPLIACRR